MIGLLLPLTLSSTAQTPSSWKAAGQGPQASAATGNAAASTAPYMSPTQPRPYRTSLAEQNVQPLAAGFDVRAFETMAEHLTVGQRVPGRCRGMMRGRGPCPGPRRVAARRFPEGGVP